MFLFSGGAGEGVLLRLPDGTIVRVVITRPKNGRLHIGIDAPQSVKIVRVSECVSSVYVPEE